MASKPAQSITKQFAFVEDPRTLNKVHGRIEIRQCWTLSDPGFFGYVRHRHQRSCLQTVVMVRAERRIQG